ncbi:MAG: adenylate/guanylate cyclase domain-containing protein [Prolixibacteraceae bacterium]
MDKRAIQIEKQGQNIRHQRLLVFSKLIYNLAFWNILLRLFLFLNILIYPEIVTSGAKIFQLMYQNGWIIGAMASTVAFVTWLQEDVLFYRYLSKKSLGAMMLLRIIFLAVILIIVFLVTSLYHYHDKIFTGFSEYLLLIKWFFINSAALYLFTVGILISFMINFSKAIKSKVGYENFYRIISGYYRKPREEDRIFIFIDLISSTRYAELLGHQKYSAFLQACFMELGLLEIKYRAMQYQIIGDEVVLSWEASKIKNFKNAVNFYYEFAEQLHRKRSYFKKEFGIIPKFTASVNSGKIMVAEVGTIKSEIAFHGDVLNTAARIQKQCKSYNRRLLVTKNFAEKFREVSFGYQIEWLAFDRLLGKQNPVDIYAIEPLEKELLSGLSYQAEVFEPDEKKELA